MRSAALVALLVLAGLVHAHKPSDSYLSLEASGNNFELRARQSTAEQIRGKGPFLPLVPLLHRETPQLDWPPLKFRTKPWPKRPN